MNIKDYQDGLIVEVKGCDYGTFKTYQLLPKDKGARMVKVLHSATFGEIDWSFALVKTFRLIDLKKKEK